MDDRDHRLSELEAARAISELRSRYCAIVDARRWHELPELFTADAVFAGAFFRAEGHAAILEAFEGVPDAMDEWWHFVSNEITSIEGPAAASGSCYFDAPCVIGGESWICAGRYDERFARGDDGAWRFEARRITYFYFTAARNGWSGGVTPPGA